MKLSFLLGALSVEVALVVGVASCATATDPGMPSGSGGKGGSGGSGGSVVGHGGANQGGSSTGGTNTGGTSAGGTSTGGTNQGGSSTGGTSTGGTSTGGSSTGGSSTGGTSTGGASGTGGATGCEITTGDATCDGCVGSKCKTECLTCQNNPECLSLLKCIDGCPSGDSACQKDCQLSYPDGVTDAVALNGATSGCISNVCDVACSGGGGTGGSGGGTYDLPSGCFFDGPSICNPMTNAGCASDEACDYGMTGMECFPPPNTAGLGQTCSNNDPGPYCAATLHCSTDTYKCRTICCDDLDCPGTKLCIPLDPAMGSFGICE